MPVLRLFAAAREAAGTATAEVPGGTVDEVLASARALYGDHFAQVLGRSKVWCNGSPAVGDQSVGPGDEVAVLPPVSGGADPRPPDQGPAPPSPATRSGTTAPASARRRPHRGGSSRARPDRAGHGGSHPVESPPEAGPDAESPIPPRRRPGRLTRSPTITGAPNDPAAVPEAAVPRPDRLTRLRSVPVPVTGQVTIRGRERAVAGTGERRTLLGRRYAVVYDTSGHQVTYGVAWFAAAVGCLALGWAPLTLLFGVAAGWAALEAAARSTEAGRDADPWVAGLGGGAIAAAGAAGSGYLGGAILVVVIAAIAVAATTAAAREHVLAAAGATALCAVPFGLAGASVLLTRDIGIGAAVVLVVFVSAYEAGDFLIGSGASNSVEGPLVGIVTIAITAVLVFVLEVPPFDGAPAFTFAALAAVACPVGQLACSAILPAADAHAPAARRLDSLLLLAPAWAFAVGLFVDSLT
ncbi:MAG: MoaD/ThiS family protein [Iamia sp.]